MDFSLDSHSIDRTFNETCCKEKGVPYECMANCKDARGPIYEGFRMGKLQSRCTKFENIIKNCIVTGNMVSNCSLQMELIIRFKSFNSFKSKFHIKIHS